jgi:hypothetical protein
MIGSIWGKVVQLLCLMLVVVGDIQWDREPVQKDKGLAQEDIGLVQLDMGQKHQDIGSAQLDMGQKKTQDTASTQLDKEQELCHHGQNWVNLCGPRINLSIRFDLTSIYRIHVLYVYTCTQLTIVL